MVLDKNDEVKSTLDKTIKLRITEDEINMIDDLVEFQNLHTSIRDCEFFNRSSLLRHLLNLYYFDTMRYDSE